MRCFICGGEMIQYFSKVFKLCSLDRVNYLKCVHCGLVVSRNHFQMAEENWQELNRKYHSEFFGTDENKDDPKWIQRLENQKEAILELAVQKIIPRKQPWVDWGCGDGKLSGLLRERGLSLLKYDRYMSDASGFLSDDELKAQKYDFVITTSVFEHIRSIEQLEEINGLVSMNGVLATHTMVKEQISPDPEWYYLLPVHCTFYTNKSMQILFDKWGYKASIYHPLSRLWFFFKNDEDRIESEVARLNEQNICQDREKIYHFKRGFMDYWK